MDEDKLPTILYHVSHCLPAAGTSKGIVPSLIVGAILTLVLCENVGLEGGVARSLVKPFED